MKENQVTIRAALWDEIIFWLLIALICLVPIAMTRYTIACFEPIKLFILKTGAILIIACWVIKIVQEKKIQLTYTFLWLPLLLFLIITSLATLLSIQLHTSVHGQLYRYEGLLTTGIYFLLFYATVNFIQQRRQLNILLATVVASSTVIAIYGVLQHLGWDFISWNPTIMPVDRSFSTFGNPVFLGGYLCLVFPIALIMLFQKRTIVAQILLLISTSLLITCLVFTNTRAAVLGVIASVVLIMILAFRLLWRRKSILALAGAVLLLGGLSTLSTPKQQRSSQESSSGFTQRVTEATELEKSTFGSRLFVWKTSLAAVADKPLLGFGPDTFEYTYLHYRPRSWYKTLVEKPPFDKAHNEFLQIATTEGLLGTLAFCWLIASFFWHAITNISSSKKEANTEKSLLLLGIAAGIAGYLVQIQSSFSVFSYTFLFWSMLGLGALFAYPARQQLPQVEINFERSPDPQIWQSIVYVLIFAAAIASTYFAALPFAAEIYIRRGANKLKENLSLEATTEFSRAVELDPSEVRHWLYLAYTYSQDLQNNPDQPNYQTYSQSIDAFNHAQQTNPLEEDTFFYRADLNLSMGEITANPELFDLAIADLDQLLKLNPYDPEAHYNLGLAYADKEMYFEAIKEWKIALSINSELTKAYYDIGRAYQLEGNSKEAKKYYQKTLEVDPDDANAKKALEELK